MLTSRNTRNSSSHIALTPHSLFLTPSCSFLPLLSSERAQNEGVIRERLSSWGLDRLKREGYCITDAKAYWVDFQKVGRPVACFMLGPGIVFPPHVFE